MREFCFVNRTSASLIWLVLLTSAPLSLTSCAVLLTSALPPLTLWPVPLTSATSAPPSTPSTHIYGFATILGTFSTTFFLYYSRKKPLSVGDRDHYFLFYFKSFRKILPVAFFGNSSLKKIFVGTLYFTSCFAANSIISCSVNVLPFFKTI